MVFFLETGKEPDPSSPWKCPSELQRDDWRNPVSVNSLRIAAALWFARPNRRAASYGKRLLGWNAFGTVRLAKISETAD